MNLLAHIYLSGDDEPRMIGNFIADFVRGSQIRQFSPAIIEGIQLHRVIDSYTDQHPVVKQSIARLKPTYARYAGVIIDVVYDHFLANNFAKYSEIPLAQFAQKTYKTLLAHQSVLPPKVQNFLPNMIENNWLLHYGDTEGVRRSLASLSRRSSFVDNLENAIQEMNLYYEAFDTEFNQFFPDLIKRTQEEIDRQNADT